MYTVEIVLIEILVDHVVEVVLVEILVDHIVVVVVEVVIGHNDIHTNVVVHIVVDVLVRKSKIIVVVKVRIDQIGIGSIEKCSHFSVERG